MLTSIAVVTGLALAGLSSPIPSSTDEARELTAAARRDSPAAVRAAPTKRIPSSTDEARELAAASVPTTTASSQPAVATMPSSTDEARGNSPARPMRVKAARERTAKPCVKECACARG